MDKKTEDKYKKVIAQMHEMMLANLVMVGQIPSHTFEEMERGKFVLTRFFEDGLIEPFTDEVGNVIGVVEGKKRTNVKRKKILLSAQMDTIYPKTVDHNILVQDKKAIGSGIADNALGLSTLMILPELLERVGLELEADIILLGSVRTRERGDLEGIRHFVETNRNEIDYHINISGLSEFVHEVKNDNQQSEIKYGVKHTE